MSLESASKIGQLNPANPSGADMRRTADDHLRLIKAVLKAQLGTANDEPLSVKFSVLNTLAGLVTPVGAIVAFGLPVSQIPVGWALCDGSVVNRSDGTGTIATPDLRGRVIAGATEARPQGTSFGQASRTITTEAAGAHTHTGSTASAGAHTHDLSGLTVGSSPTGVTASLNTRSQDDDPGSGATNVNSVNINDPGHTHTVTGGSAGSAGAHTHDVTIVEGGAHGHQLTVSVEQPSLSINYIMKI